MALYDDIFIKVAECKSYTNTAKMLKLSQPSIRRRIQSLEKLLGQALVNSSINTITITDFGSRLYEQFKDKDTELQQLLSSLSDNNQQASGELHITLPINFAYRLITPYLHEFVNQYPDIKLIIDYERNDSNFISSGAHIGVTVTLPIQPSLIIRKLYTAKILLYCTQQYAAKYNIPKNIKELEQKHNLCHFNTSSLDKNQPTILISKSVNKERLLKNRSAVVFNNTSIGKALLHSDEFIVGMEDYEYFFSNKADLIQVLPEYELPECKYYLVLPSKYKDAKTKVFCDFLDQCIEQHRQTIATINELK